MKIFRLYFQLLGLSILMVSCTVTRTATSMKNIRLMDVYTIPHRMQFQGTTVGGLSGIDYDAASDLYYLVCDDRSDINPARFYTARIMLNEKGIDSVQFTGTAILLQKNGKPYPIKYEDPFHVPDPEALRFHPTSRSIYWTSEGERFLRNDTIILNNPALYISAISGEWLDSFPVPNNMYMQSAPAGPRQNGTFEGLSFSTDYKSLFISLEEPLFEDGARAGLGDSTAWIRILEFDAFSRNCIAQYAYEIDPVVLPANPAGAFKVNGVTDILAVNEHQLLVTERSFSTGNTGSNIRVYLGDLKKAKPVAAGNSLQQNPTAKPVKKKLLFDMDKAGIFIDNVEGATWGPRLASGKRSLIFVTDDNFSARQKTQFLLFEVD